MLLSLPPVLGERCSLSVPVNLTAAVPPASGTGRYPTVCAWRVSVSIMPSELSYGVACVRISFLSSSLLYVYTTFSLFTHRWTLEWLPPLGFASDAAVGMAVQVSVRVPVFLSFAHMPRNGVAGSCHFTCNFLRGRRVVLHSGHTTFPSHRRGPRVWPPRRADTADFSAFGDSRPHGYEVVFCDLDLRFPNDYGCRTSRDVFSGHLSLLFGEVSACSGSLPTFELGCLLFSCGNSFYSGY